MRKGLFILIPIVAIAVFWSYSQPTTNNLQQTQGVSLAVTPASVQQGEPVLVTIENLGTSTVKFLKLNDKALRVFDNAGKIQSLIGLDLRMAPVTYPLELTLADGRVLKKDLTVSKRTIVSVPLGIPDKLGGNTKESEQKLLKTLADEGAIINSVPSGQIKLWSGTFRLPINPPITITDVYGYSRETGASTLSHKGTDFRAATGTPVYAMNAGLVRYTGYLRNYGHVIVLDHGLGLQTIYMHLSQILVKNGERVEKGTLIARSGDTGYVLGPHLHLTVKIDHISVDPLKFLALLGEAHTAQRSIVAFGDSLTLGVGSQRGGGFVKMLSEDLRLPITNLGVEGETTGKALARMAAAVELKPDVVILLLGGNDYLQGVPEVNTFANLEQIIKRLQVAGSTVLLLGLDSHALKSRASEFFQKLATQYRTAYILDILAGISDRPELMSDSLHPNDLGYRMMADRIKPILQSAL